jgi:leucyl/phenylalanyl-tRNA---protein transferase
MSPQPVEPSPWRFDPTQWSMLSDCVAVGADLEPSTVIAAYRHGAFPMPQDGALCWWSPALRGVLRPEDLRVSRSLRKSAQRYTVTYDTEFATVIDACADPARPGAWIDGSIRDAYVRLHELGWAHSVETRDQEGNLVGGLYGLQVGRLFAGESMFHVARDASKVALIELVGLQSGGLIDVQWSTNHLASLGVIAIDRWDYLRRLPALVDQPPPVWPSGTP